MSWICDYCSTANDSHDRICFVCDHERSRASIRAQRREEREAKWRPRISLIYNRVLNIGRIACFSLIGVLFLAALIILIAKISEGSLSDVVCVYRGIDTRIQSVLMTGSRSFDAISVKMMGYPLAAVGESLEAVFTHALFTAGDGIDGVIIEAIVNKSMKFEAFGAAVREIRELQSTQRETLGTTLKSLIVLQTDRGETLLDIAGQLRMLQTVKREVILGTVRDLTDACTARSERLIDTVGEIIRGIIVGFETLIARLTYAIGMVFAGIKTVINVIARLLRGVGERIRDLIRNAREIINRVTEPFSKL